MKQKTSMKYRNQYFRAFMLIPLCVSVWLNGKTQAQAWKGDEENGKFLVIMAGPTLPFSDFARTEMVKNAGFAGAGMNAGVEFMHFPWVHFGLSYALGYTGTSFRDDAYSSEYKRVFADGSEVAVHAGSYRFFRAMAGPAARTTLAGKAGIMVFMELGYSFDIHPEVTVDHADWGRINTIPRATDHAFTRRLGIQLEYPLSERFSLHLGYALNISKTEFLDDVGGYTGYFYLPVRYQDTGIGLSLNL